MRALIGGATRAGGLKRTFAPTLATAHPVGEAAERYRCCLRGVFQHTVFRSVEHTGGTGFAVSQLAEGSVWHGGCWGGGHDDSQTYH